MRLKQDRIEVIVSRPMLVKQTIDKRTHALYY